MQNNQPKTVIYLAAIASAAALTAVIGLSAANLAHFQVVGRTVPFAYPWRLLEPSSAARLTAWAGYLLHNLLVWAIIYIARSRKPKFAAEFRWFNWSLVGANGLFSILHIVQSQLFYDGLAQDVPELSALGSVALMLIVILILEAPRRGLILGAKMRFDQQFMQVVRHYHGYLFSWAAIYTFWFHPTEGTAGHLLGFFYMFMLFAQSALIFNRAHLNRWWKFTLEVFVLIHGVSVALLQGNNMWPMFAFGFGAMIVLTQMYGLGLNTWARRAVAAAFIAAVVISYWATGRLAQVHEVLRIPMLDYIMVFLLYGIYLGVRTITRRVRQADMLQTGDHSA